MSMKTYRGEVRKGVLLVPELPTIEDADVMITLLTPRTGAASARYIRPGMYGDGMGLTLDDFEAARREQQRAVDSEWDELERPS